MQEDTAIIVPESVKRTKKERTPAQLDALKKEETRTLKRLVYVERKKCLNLDLLHLQQL